MAQCSVKLQQKLLFFYKSEVSLQHGVAQWEYSVPLTSEEKKSNNYMAYIHIDFKSILLKWIVSRASSLQTWTKVNLFH